MRRLRISAISYLNTAPLMWDFEHGQPDNGGARHHFDISYTLPSACARDLEAGTADIGIITAAAYAQVPGLMVLPGVAIASLRPVRSILLVSNLPIEKIRTVALDTSSMTSVALTKILFEKWLGGGRTFTSMSPDIGKMLASNDAGLLIGDPALQIDRSRYVTLDLAQEWIHRQTLRLRLLGASPERVARVFAARRSYCHLSTLSRPWTRTRKPRAHLPRMGSPPRSQRSQRALLPHRKYSLPSGCCLPGRLATFLSLRGRDWSPARRSRAELFRRCKCRRGIAKSSHPL